jgi:hypothetical protein
VSEAYQYLIKKYLRKTTEDEKSHRTCDRWQLAGGKANRVLGVLGSITAAHTEKQKKIEEELRVRLNKYVDVFM